MTRGPHPTDDRSAPFIWPGRAPGIVLIHGFTGTPWEVRPVADALHACGHACEAPMLPGHGSTVQALSLQRWNDWQRAIDEAVRAALDRHRRVMLVGMSLGALLALDAAARYQDRGVCGLVTLGCALRLSPVATRVLWVASRLGERMPDVYLPKFHGSDIQDAMTRAASASYTAHPLRAARELLVGQRHAREAAAALKIPLLAIHGLLDRTAPVAASLELARIAGCDDRTLIVLPRSGHHVAVDRDQAEVVRQVCAFVRRVGDGAPDG